MIGEEHQELEWELVEEEEEIDFDRANTWETEVGKIENPHTWKLNDLIAVGYPVSSDPKNVGRTGVYVFPKGLRLCLDEITDHYSNLSLSKLERIAYCHGLAIVTHDPRIKELYKLYKAVRIRAKEDPEFDLIDELEVKSDSYNFARDAPHSNTSIGILHNRDGLVSRLARRISMTNIKLYPCLMIESVMTWPDKAWQRKLCEEHNKFWIHVEKRIARLSQLSENK